jgi:hypothetical protein
VHGTYFMWVHCFQIEQFSAPLLSSKIGEEDLSCEQLIVFAVRGRHRWNSHAHLALAETRQEVELVAVCARARSQTLSLESEFC